MDDSLWRCAKAIKLIDAFLSRHQSNGGYDRWLERYSKRPEDHDDAFLFGKLVQAMFSSGLKGQTVDMWMPRMERAFHSWDIYRIAEIDTEEIERLAASGEVIANLPKLEGVVKNAAAAIALAKQHGTFGRYLTSMPVSALSMDIANRFKYLGRVTTEDLLKNVGFDTAKPDRHLTRWLTRMGAIEADSSPAQVLDVVRAIADSAKIRKVHVDAVIYLFCADRSDIISWGICGKVPAWVRCPLGDLCLRIEPSL